VAFLLRNDAAAAPATQTGQAPVLHTFLSTAASYASLLAAQA